MAPYTKACRKKNRRKKSGYIVFYMSMLQAYPKCLITSVAKKAGEMWKAMSPCEQETYNRKAEKTVGVKRTCSGCLAQKGRSVRRVGRRGGYVTRRCRPKVARPNHVKNSANLNMRIHESLSNVVPTCVRFEGKPRSNLQPPLDPRIHKSLSNVVPTCVRFEGNRSKPHSNLQPQADPRIHKSLSNVVPCVRFEGNRGKPHSNLQPQADPRIYKSLSNVVPCIRFEGNRGKPRSYLQPSLDPMTQSREQYVSASETCSCRHSHDKPSTSAGYSRSFHHTVTKTQSQSSNIEVQHSGQHRPDRFVRLRCSCGFQHEISISDVRRGESRQCRCGRETGPQMQLGLREERYERGHSSGQHEQNRKRSTGESEKQSRYRKEERSSRQQRRRDSRCSCGRKNCKSRKKPEKKRKESNNRTRPTQQKRTETKNKSNNNYQGTENKNKRKAESETENREEKKKKGFYDWWYT